MNTTDLLPSVLKARRMNLKLTQDELAAASKVDRGSISRLERGLKVYGPDRTKLAEFFGVTEEQLLEDSKTPFTGEFPGGAPAASPEAVHV
jgi:transcriptional regulator with XRE-family HTH domain